MKHAVRLVAIALALGSALAGAYQIRAGGNTECVPSSECCPEDCGPCDPGQGCGGCCS